MKRAANDVQEMRKLRRKLQNGKVVVTRRRVKISNYDNLRFYNCHINGDNNNIEGDDNLVFGDNNFVRGSNNRCFSIRVPHSNVVEEAPPNAERGEMRKPLPLNKFEKQIIEQNTALTTLLERIDAVDADENNRLIESECLEPLARGGGHPMPNQFRRFAFELPAGVREASTEALECILCCKNERQILFFPCSHFQCCRDCVLRLIGTNDPCEEFCCPTCRQVVKYSKCVYL